MISAAPRSWRDTAFESLSLTGLATRANRTIDHGTKSSSWH
jgi:hypothetical protein